MIKSHNQSGMFFLTIKIVALFNATKKFFCSDISVCAIKYFLLRASLIRLYCAEK